MKTKWFKKHWFGLATILAMVLGSILLTSQLLPHKPPDFRHPSVLELFLASRAAILGVRLVLYNAAVFVVASIAARAYAGEWIFKVGPVETPKDVADQKHVVEELAKWKPRAEAAEAKIEQMDAALKKTEANYKRVVAELAEAEAKLAGGHQEPSTET